MGKNKIPSLVVVLILIGIASIYSVYQYRPILISWARDKARIIGKPIPSTVYINGKKADTAKIFQQKTTFDGSQETDYFILFLPGKIDRKAVTVWIIDRENHDIKRPNSRIDYYDVIFGYMLQSESGSLSIYSLKNDMKGNLEIETNLEITDNSIEFELPGLSEYKIKTISIKL